MVKKCQMKALKSFLNFLLRWCVKLDWNLLNFYQAEDNVEVGFVRSIENEETCFYIMLKHV